MKATIYFLSYQKETFANEKNELMQYGFQHYFGFPYEEAEIFIEKNGKPQLLTSKFPNHYFNLSHSKHYMALGCSHTTVGIDLEEPRLFSTRLLNRISTPEEISIVNTYASRDKIGLLLWTLKESYIKYIGVGLSLPLAAIQLPLKSDLNLDCSYFILTSNTLTVEPLYFHCFQETNYRMTLCSNTNTKPNILKLKR